MTQPAENFQAQQASDAQGSDRQLSDQTAAIGEEVRKIADKLDDLMTTVNQLLKSNGDISTELAVIQGKLAEIAQRGNTATLA